MSNDTLLTKKVSDTNRRSFLKTSIATVAAAAATNFRAPAAIANKKIRWRMALAVPKTLPIWGTGLQRFAKNVKQISNGQLDIRVYGDGELIPGLGVFDAVRNGELEMGHAASYYWIGKLPVSPFFSTVPFGMTATGQKAWLNFGGGQKLWDEAYNALGIQGYHCGNTSVQMGGWYRKPINSIADFKGLKMRIPGLGGKVFEKVGGKPVLVPGGEIFTNLSTGVIDATEWVGPYHDYTMGFHKVAPYYYYPGWHEPGAILELMINKKAWDKLPKDLQLIVRTCANALDAEMAIEWPAKDAEYLAKIKSEGKTKILAFPPAVLNELRKASEAAKTELANTSELGKRIYASYQKFQKQMTAYDAVSNYAFAQALHNK